MLNLCSRRWGLCISITRFVHFGPMPQRLQDAFAAAAEVNARLLAATKTGTTCSGIICHREQIPMHRADYPGEELRHHQGGATGYGEREWLATPAGKERVVNMQAFAWNPSVSRRQGRGHRPAARRRNRTAHRHARICLASRPQAGDLW